VSNPLTITPVWPSHVSARWRLRLLGGFELDNGHEPLTRLRSRATVLLLSRLALAPSRVHPREELCELLWPGALAAAGRSRLRQTLSLLRALLEPPGSPQVLLADRRVLRLVPDALWCDATAFEQAALEGDAVRALGCYGGELLPGFYDDWVQEERSRLAGLAEALTSAAPAEAAPLAAAPAAASAARSDDRLPSYCTRAFGLLPTLVRLREQIGTARLVTLHGPGGSGKTRLAVELAQAYRAAVPARFARVVFVPLLPCTNTAAALDVTCQALGADGPGDAQSRLAAALDGRSALLVLDNAEQLVADHLGSAITRLVAALPELHVLVTSRRVLDVDGETAFALDGLTLPAADAGTAAAAGNPALELFVARARAARADFHLGTPHHAEAAVALVRLLGGMPLAIELAALRMRSMTAGELLQRLRADAGSPMLDLLARGSPRASPDTRHASMRHTIAWSWQQLDARQMRLLQALSLPASPVRVEALAALAGVDASAARDLLAELLAASLVLAVEGADGCVRHAASQPVREFAAETLSAAGARAARARLRRWLLGFAARAMAGGPTTIAPDIGLVDLMITTAPGDGAAREALELAAIVRVHWDTSLPHAAVLHALVAAMRDVDDPDLLGQTLDLLTFARLMQGQTGEALSHADAAIALPCNDRVRSIALARWSWARYTAGRLDTDFDTPLDEALVLARRSGDLLAQARVLHMQSMIECNLRLQYELCERLSAERQQLFVILGNRPGATMALMSRAVMWAHVGRIDEGIAAARECEAMGRADGNPAGLASITQQLARVYMLARRWDEAAAAFRRSIRIGWDHLLAQLLARAMLHLPDALALGPDVGTAALLHGFGTAHYERHYGAVNRIEAREVRRTRRLLRQRLGLAQFAARGVEGAGLTMAKAVALALDDSRAAAC